MQIGASLADMFFAADQVADAESAVKFAMTAAESASQHALWVKLCNNLASVYRNRDQ
jgi:hypothetical protein